MKKAIFAAMATVLLSGCAAQMPRIRDTQSGYPETVFRHESVSAVKNELVRACETRGSEVLDSSDNSVTCGKELAGGQAFVATLAIGNSYSTTPMQKVRFNFYKEGADVKVIAHQWIETQMASGQVSKADLNSNNQFNEMQTFLDKLSY